MLPTLEIGVFRLNTYWLILSLGIVAGGMLAFHRLVQGGIPPRKALRGLWLIIWVGVAGAVLGKSLTLMARDLLQTGALAGGVVQGSAFLAGLLSGAIASWLWFRQGSLATGRVFDLILVPLPLSQAIGRIGCLAAACCFGKPTASWLGLYLPDHDGFWAVRYPTQLLSAAADLLIFFLLLRLERAIGQRQPWTQRLAFDGALASAYLLLYAAKRFGIEFLRADAALPLIGAFTLMHVLSAALFLLACLALMQGATHRRPAAKQVQGVVP